MAKIKRLFNWLKNTYFWPSFLSGIVYFGYIFLWSWNLYPLESFGVSNKLGSLLVIFAIYSIAVFSMAIFWGGFGLLCFKIISIKKLRLSLIPFVLAGNFVLAEYSRSFFYGIVWLGDGSLIGPHWTMGNLAYLFSSFSPIIKSSSLWGIYGIDFILILSISWLILFFSKHHYKKMLIIPVLALILFFFIDIELQHKPNQTSDVKIPIAIIQTQALTKPFYTSSENLEKFKNQLELLNRASQFIDSAENNSSGLIIFPETSNFITVISKFLDANSTENYFDKLSENELFIIDQLRSDESNGLKSKTILISSKKGLLASYDKRLLTPAGEFLPYIIKIPLFILAPSLNQLNLALELKKGESNNLIYFNDISIKTAICSELLSPSIVSDQNSDFIVALHNFGLFHGGRLLEKQILAISKFRAAENGKYSVTSSNYGKSYIINPEGKVEKIAQNTGYELLTGTIIPNKSQTWYNYLGDWPILLLSSVFLSIGLRAVKRAH